MASKASRFSRQRRGPAPQTSRATGGAPAFYSAMNECVTVEMPGLFTRTCLTNKKSHMKPDFGGVPSSHPSLGLAVFFLSFLGSEMWSLREESSINSRGQNMPRGGQSYAERREQGIGRRRRRRTRQRRACLLYTSPSPRDYAASRMPSSA